MTTANVNIRRLTWSAIWLALALVLPFLTGQIPTVGSMLCPMHIPVLLCGFTCGWPWGLLVGFVAPPLRMVLFGMPPMMVAIPMAFELAAYGLVAGLLYKKLPKSKGNIYVTLISAMVIGRLVWGVVKFVMMGLSATAFPMSAFISGAITTAIPGIILHIVLIPLVVKLLEKHKLILND